MKKFLLLLILLVVGSYFGFSWFLKSSVQTVIKSISGVDASVADVSFDYNNGAGLLLKNVTIGNPQGYNSEFALRAPSIKLVGEPGNSTSLATLSQIIISDAEVNFEMGADGNNANLIALSQQLTTSNDASQKLSVKDVIIKNASVKLIVPGVTDATAPQPVIISELVINDVNPDGSKSINAVVGRIVDEISKNAVGAGNAQPTPPVADPALDAPSGSNTAPIDSAPQSGIEPAIQQGGEAIDAIKNEADGAIKAIDQTKDAIGGTIDDAAKSAGEATGNIIDNAKDGIEKATDAVKDGAEAVKDGVDSVIPEAPIQPAQPPVPAQ